MTDVFSRPIDLHGDSTALWSQLRREVYGVDVRQHGWSTRAELARMVDWMRLGPNSYVLDIGCGEGGPAQFLAAESDARVVGVELDLKLVQAGQIAGSGSDLEPRVKIVVADASRPLGFRSRAFDAICCVDVVPHLVELDSALSDWRRLLAQHESRLLVIDPVVPFGPVSHSEFRLRTGGVHYEMRPATEFSGALQRTNLHLLEQIDLTLEMVAIADAWAAAVTRERRSLVRLEGAAVVQHQLDFCRLVLKLGTSRRLRRIAYLATARE